MAGIEAIVRDAEEERKIKKTMDATPHIEKDTKNKAEAHRILKDLKICEELMSKGYQEVTSPSLQARIETVRDRCRTVTEELHRIYGEE